MGEFDGEIASMWICPYYSTTRTIKGAEDKEPSVGEMYNVDFIDMTRPISVRVLAIFKEIVVVETVSQLYDKIGQKLKREYSYPLENATFYSLDRTELL